MTDTTSGTARTKLAAALHDAADPLPGYDVLDGAIAHGRRRRRHSVGAAVVAVIAVLALASGVAISLAPALRADTAVAQPGPPSIPEHIGQPAPFTRSATDGPAGAASLIFTDARGRVVAVGAESDTYRLVGVEATAGANALLSPTGDRVAYPARRGVIVVNLVRGGERRYPDPDPDADGFSPLAWMPDGTGVVVVSTTNADDPTTQGVTKRLSVLDLDSGEVEQFAEATWPLAPDGFAVAISPDGSRIAYQFSNFVTVFDRATGGKTRIDFDSYFHLAGRAAWAPDGSLVLLHPVFNQCPTAAPCPTTWTWELSLVDPATGTPRSTVPLAIDADLIRLIGWSGGDPIVVGYTGQYAHFDGYNISTSAFEGMVTVHGLASRPLVHPVEGVAAIDVAEVLLTDPRTRPGSPPWTLPFPPPSDWLVVVAAILLVVVPVAGGGTLLRGRWRWPGSRAQRPR